MSDHIEWRGLRLDASQGWVAWFIASDRVRILNPGETPTTALEATYHEVMKLSTRLSQALSEID